MRLKTRSRTFRSQGHTKVWQVRGIDQRNIVSKYEVNLFTNKKVMATVVYFTTFDHQGQGHSEVKVTFHKFLPSRSRSFRGQGHTKVGQVRGLAQRNIVSKYEVNRITNKEVMANVKVFHAAGRRRTQGNRAIAIPRHFLRKQPS